MRSPSVQWAMPFNISNPVLFYNKKMFDDAGVAYPTNDWTWDDLRTAAKKLTDASQRTYGLGFSVSGSEDTTWHLWPLLWQKGGKILSDDGKSASFNSDAGVQALDFLRSMAEANALSVPTGTSPTAVSHQSRPPAASSSLPRAAVPSIPAGTVIAVRPSPG